MPRQHSAREGSASNRRSPVERVLDEFGVGDGLVNATSQDAERMAVEIVRLRNDADERETAALRRKYIDYGHGPQEPPNGREGKS